MDILIHTQIKDTTVELQSLIEWVNVHIGSGSTLPYEIQRIYMPIYRFKLSKAIQRADELITKFPSDHYLDDEMVLVKSQLLMAIVKSRDLM